MEETISVEELIRELLGKNVYRLESGLIVPQSLAIGLLIDTDSPEVTDFIQQVKEEISKDLVPAWFAVYRSSMNRLQTITMGELTRIASGRTQVPLSEYLRLKKGSCLQYSSIGQLGFQDAGVESYLVVANIHEFEGDWTHDHAYNLARIDDEMNVVDITNPLILSDGTRKAYRVPIRQVKIRDFGDFKELVFVAPPEFGSRQYTFN